MQDYIAVKGKQYHFDNIYRPGLPLTMVNLYQAGEIIAGSGYTIEAHKQAYLEISYVVSGRCTFYAGDNILHAVQGDLHVIPKGIRHKIVADEHHHFRMAYLAFTFPKETVWPDIRDFYEAPPELLLNDCHNSRQLFEELLEEIYAAQPYSETAIDACVSRILLHIWRIFTHGGERENRRIVEEARVSRIIGSTVFHALRYIDSHIDKLHSISEIASQLQYNPSYLSRVFHEKTGMTLSAYIDEKKCALAKELLAQGLSVGEIAERLGYASSQSFCKMFVRCVGCSPTAYLKQQNASK